MKSCLSSILLAMMSMGVSHGMDMEGFELRGQMTLEARSYVSSPLYPDQEKFGASLSVEPELFWEVNSNHSFALTPKFTLDQNDDERNSFDLREAYWQALSGPWEMKLGVAQVYWGRTEFVHLVNVINQTDLIDSIDEEEKLGQPMLEVSHLFESSTLQAWVLPGFRQRTFPGREGRLRGPLVVDTDDDTYESSQEERHVDVAMRYSAYFGDLDWAVSAFHGTHRSPQLLPELVNSKIRPHYRQTTQLSFDAVYVWESWLLKFEGLNRHLSGEDHQAVTGGGEYSFVGILETEQDLGFIIEGAWHSEKDRESTFASEVMTGLRWVLNDVQGTEILGGVIVDWEKSSKLFSLEASRRLGDEFKLELEGRWFADVDSNDSLYALRRDGHLKLQLHYFF